MKTITNDEIKELRKHMNIAREEIQKTLADLAKGGVSLAAIHIVFLEGVAMTEQKMRQTGTTDHGISNCKLIAKANIGDLIKGE